MKVLIVYYTKADNIFKTHITDQISKIQNELTGVQIFLSFVVHSNDSSHYRNYKKLTSVKVV